MLKAHGIENDTECLISSTTKEKYPFTKFAHALRTKDLFSFYDTSLIRVIPNQGYAIRRVLGEGTNSTSIRIAQQVFLKGMMMIINGIIDRKFIFQMPFKNLDVKLKVILMTREESKPLFKYWRGQVDPLELGFQMNKVILEVRYKKRPPIIFGVHVPMNMYATMMENKMSNLTYQNSKIATLKDIVEDLIPIYPQLEKSSISSALRHGLNTLFKGLIYQCDSYINLDKTDDKFFVYFSGSRKVTQYVKVRKKTRFLMKNKKGMKREQGIYYFSLTDSNMNLFNEGETIRMCCTRYIEELTICKQYAKNIYKIKLEDIKRQALFVNINKEDDNTEYIYRWDGQGFESIDNT